MSHQCLADAFAPAEAKYQEQVMQSTWGHLAPEKNKTYRGFIIFAIGYYDDLNPMPLNVRFKGLNDSPWFYEALTEFIGKPQWNTSRKKFKSGGVYRFDGTFNNYKFRGRIWRVKLGIQ